MLGRCVRGWSTYAKIFLPSFNANVKTLLEKRKIRVEKNGKFIIWLDGDRRAQECQRRKKMRFGYEDESQTFLKQEETLLAFLLDATRRL